MLLLSQRRSLSPITRRHHNRDTNHRPPPSRLSLLGHHTFYHRNDDSDNADDDAKNNKTRLSGSGKPFTRRTTLPENIKPMQNDNESTIMEPNAMRYLPKILRDIYAQRQTRRPSEVSTLDFVFHVICAALCLLLYNITVLCSYLMPSTSQNTHINNTHTQTQLLRLVKPN
jgi:hypothetical protein